MRTNLFISILVLGLIAFDFAECFCDQQGDSCSVYDQMTQKCYECYNIQNFGTTFDCRADETCTVNSAFGGCAKCCQKNDIECF